MLPCTLQVARIKNRSKSDALQFEGYKVEEQAVATFSAEINKPGRVSGAAQGGNIIRKLIVDDKVCRILWKEYFWKVGQMETPYWISLSNI